MSIEVTPALVKAYLESKAEDETIGFCGDAHQCLVAQAIQWKYPHITYIFAAYDVIDFRDKGGPIDFVETSPDIARVITAFDEMGGGGNSVSKGDFLKRYHSLLQEGNPHA